MKKILWLMIVASASIYASGAVLGDAQNGVSEAGKLMGTLMFLVITLFWTLPVLLGIVVYVTVKKKKEQEREEMGVGDAFKIVLGVIIGGAAGYYIVGSIGALAIGGSPGLGQGNTYFLQKLLNAGKNQIR